IETVGLGWDTLAPDVQEYLLERARSEEERAAVPERLALHPGTGRVVAIGLWRPEEDRGGVLVATDAAGDGGGREGAGGRGAVAPAASDAPDASASRGAAGAPASRGAAGAPASPAAPDWQPFEHGALIYRGTEREI